MEYVFAPWDVLRITLRANSSLKAARGESVDVEPQEQELFGQACRWRLPPREMSDEKELRLLHSDSRSRIGAVAARYAAR